MKWREVIRKRERIGIAISIMTISQLLTDEVKAVGSWVAERNGCTVLDELQELHRTFIWDGACKDGKAVGFGSKVFIYPSGSRKTITGRWDDTGSITGPAVVEFSSLAAGSRIRLSTTFGADGLFDGVSQYTYQQETAQVFFEMQYLHGVALQHEPCTITAYPTDGSTYLDERNGGSTYAQAELSDCTFDVSGKRGRMFDDILGVGTLKKGALLPAGEVEMTWTGPVHGINPDGRGKFVISDASDGKGIGSYCDGDFSLINFNAVCYSADGIVTGRWVNRVYQSENVASVQNGAAKSDALSDFLSGALMNAIAVKAAGKSAGVRLNNAKLLALSLKSSMERQVVAESNEESALVDKAYRSARDNPSQHNINVCRSTAREIGFARRQRCLQQFSEVRDARAECLDTAKERVGGLESRCNDLAEK